MSPCSPHGRRPCVCYSEHLLQIFFSLIRWASGGHAARPVIILLGEKTNFDGCGPSDCLAAHVEVYQPVTLIKK